RPDDAARRDEPDPAPVVRLHLVLKAAMCAPSAHNKQPWHFVVVRDKALLASVAERHPYAKMAAEAPVVIVVCANPEEAKAPGYWQQDCTAALENILIAARGLNIGTVWCGMYPFEDRVEPIRELLNVPAQINMLGLVVMGHPAQPFAEADRFNESKIHLNGW
ncbi:MAG: nitroreductase family protein, partial [Desulfovibrio sp.]